MFTLASRHGGMLWRDLRGDQNRNGGTAQAMKQNESAKGELAVALMVERIKSTTTYAQMGARVSITADRARELVARGVRMVATATQSVTCQWTI